MSTLHLRIAEFKFTHNFIICNKLREMELIFGFGIQRKISLSYAWDKVKNCYIQKEGKFLTYTKNCEQKATIGTVKLTLKILPWHNGVVPIKISGPSIEEQRAYFIRDDNTTKGREQNIHTQDWRQNICQYTCFKLYKHLTFFKGEYIGHLEPAITDDTTIDQTEAHQTNSIILQKMVAEQVKPDVFNPTFHKWTTNIQNELDALLKGIWITIHEGWNINWNYTSHQHVNWHRKFRSCFSETLPLCYETLPMGKGGNRKITCSQGHLQ